MKSFRILAGAACLGVSALLAAGCSSSSSPAPSAPPAATSPAAGSTAGASTSGAVTLGTASTSLGTVLTGPGGLTLYRYDPDTSTSSACTAGCAAVWPPVTGTAMAGTGVTASNLGTISRSDGSMQITYQGHPLYTYTGDTGPGQTNGNGVQGTWHVVLVTGGAAGTAPTSVPTTKAASGGGGY